MEAVHATATTHDADLVLRLYDLRREAEMRKARNWFASEFWPRDFSELEQTIMQFGTQPSRWFGQVLSYWDMAAALVVRGALHPGLFLDSCAEGWFVYAKLKPFIQEFRTKFSPEFLVHLEQAIEATPEGRARLERTQQMIARFGPMMDERRKKQQQSAA